MIVKSILNEQKEFATIEDLKVYVKENANQIIDFKKSIEQKSVDKGIMVNCKVLNNFRLEVSEKAIQTVRRYCYISPQHYFVLLSIQVFQLHNRHILSVLVV